MKLFAQQEIENEMINKTTNFIKVKMEDITRKRKSKKQKLKLFFRHVSRNSSSFRTNRFDSVSKFAFDVNLIQIHFIFHSSSS